MTEKLKRRINLPCDKKIVESQAWTPAKYLFRKSNKSLVYKTFFKNLIKNFVNLRFCNTAKSFLCSKKFFRKFLSLIYFKTHFSTQNNQKSYLHFV